MRNIAIASAAPRCLIFYDRDMSADLSRSHHRVVPRLVQRGPRAVAHRPSSRAILDAVIDAEPAPVASPAGADPYGGYSRQLTRDGGILLTYRDADIRWRYTVWRVLAWTAFTWFEGWILFGPSAPLESGGTNFFCLLAAALVNFLIVRKPITAGHSVEIRPDGMIIDGKSVFWIGLMQAGWPTFQRDEDGNIILSGIYGTRFVEYATPHPLDENDRTGDVLAAHVQAAMQQLWAPGLAFERAPDPRQSCVRL